MKINYVLIVNFKNGYLFTLSKLVSKVPFTFKDITKDEQLPYPTTRHFLLPNFVRQVFISCKEDKAKHR